MHHTRAVLGALAAAAATVLVLTTASVEPAAAPATAGPTGLATMVTPLRSEELPPCKTLHKGPPKKKHKVHGKPQRSGSADCNPQE
ncbi:MAG TPA: hypothetical protein VGH89_22070 [Pseudonocardia sp.]|jgi:hypothetical protein